MRAGRSPGVVLRARHGESRPGASPIAPTSPSASPRPISRCSPASRSAQGLLPDEDERVGARLPGIGFDDSAHNRAITWDAPADADERVGRHVLRHARHRSITGAGGARPAARRRAEGRRAAAAARRARYWEYNDVRINQLSLALLHLFRRPLPEVFLEQRAAAARRRRRLPWRGYDDAWVEMPASAACSRCRAARTGAPASRSARATRRASASCCSTAARTAGAS